MLKDYWEDIYANRSEDELSWFQEQPAYSLSLINRAQLSQDAPIIDVGGGASRLVDHLLNSGFTDLTLLDLAGQALERTRQRLGPRAENVTFIEHDILTVELPKTYTLWHDRAVFHFLTEPEQRLAYRRRLLDHLDDEGYLIIATFDQDGPVTCSGLPVVRYSIDELEEEFSQDFHLLQFLREEHQTPAGRSQNFIFALFQRL